MTLPAASLDNDAYLWADDSGFPIAKLRQSPSANTLFTVDYSNWLALGETIVSAVYTIGPTTSPAIAVTNSEIIEVSDVAAAGLSFLLGGGVDWTRYSISIAVTTSTSQTKTDTLLLQVTSDVAYLGGLSGAPYPLQAVPVTVGSGGLATAPTTTGGLAWATSQANVTTGGTLILAARTGVSGVGRIQATLRNRGTDTVWIGNVGVTSGTGEPMDPGDVIEISTQAAIYGVANSGSQLITCMETY